MFVDHLTEHTHRTNGRRATETAVAKAGNTCRGRNPGGIVGEPPTEAGIREAGIREAGIREAGIRDSGDREVWSVTRCQGADVHSPVQRAGRDSRTNDASREFRGRGRSNPSWTDSTPR